MSTTAGRATELAIEPIDRLKLCFMTAALEDPNPVHVDEPFAQARGLPSVIAHATVPYGALGIMLERWVGLEHVRRLSVRFLKSVYPGDALTAHGSIDPEPDADGLWSVRLEVRNQDGVVVSAGTSLIDRVPEG
jgi:acyl dehydratase